MALSWLRHLIHGPKRSGPSRRSRPRRPSRFRPPRLESLEDRTVPSASIPLNHLTWTSMGPSPIDPNIFGLGDVGPLSGRVEGIAVDPTAQAGTYYIAAAGGGVWKTINAGTTWTPLTDSQATLTMGSLTIAPNNNNIIYAGTGDPDGALSEPGSDISYDASYGLGVLKSVNGGQSWTLLGNGPFYRKAIAKISVDPTNSSTVYAAVADAKANGLPDNDGIWKSTDGGVNWTNVTANAGFSTVRPWYDVVVDPVTPTTVYASVTGPPTNPAPVHPNGVYKSLDGGVTWNLVKGRLPSGPAVGRTALAISKTNSPQTIYAAVGAWDGGLLNLMKSTNGGSNWADQTPNVPGYMGESIFANALIVDPTNANVVYAASTDIVETTDGGNTWSVIDPPNVFGIPAVFLDHSLTFTANGKLLMGSDYGVFRLDNSNPASPVWTDLNTNLQTLLLNSVALHPTDLNTAYAAVQTHGAVGFANSVHWKHLELGDGGKMLLDAGHPQVVYYESATGVIEQSKDGGGTWKVVFTSGDFPQNDYFPPLAMDPGDSTRLIFGGDNVYESLNSNIKVTFNQIGGPGFRGWIDTVPLDAVGIAQTDPDTIYAEGAGIFFITHDHGVNWKEVLVPGAGPNTHFTHIEVYPADDQGSNPASNIIFLSAGSFRDAKQPGQLYQSLDGGVTWHNITGDLPDVPVNTILLDPWTKALFLGTDQGVFKTNSFQGNIGNTSPHWTPMGQGMPDARVVDLQLNTVQYQTATHAGYVLSAATHGRGMFQILTTHLVMTGAPGSITAGTPFTVTVEARDAFDQKVSGFAGTYTGTVHFTSTDAQGVLPKDYSFTTQDNDVHSFSIDLKTAGQQKVSVQDQVAGADSDSFTITVNPGPASQFVVSAPVSVTAGVPFDVTVTALDQYNNVATGYNGTVQFNTSDPGAGVVVPGNYTFTTGAGGDDGVHTFPSLKLVTAGNQTLSVADTNDVLLNGATSILVNPAAASHFVISAPASVTAGTAFSFSVTALDPFGNRDINYTGTVHFTTSDTNPAVALTADYTFTSGSGGDNGSHVFGGGAIFATAGSQSLTATDTANPGVSGTTFITVTPNIAVALGISAPASTSAGSPFTVKVTAFDAYGNVATAYTGTVHFTSSDSGSGVVLPPDYTFTSGSGQDNGVHTFPNGAVLVTEGSQTVSAADVADAGITGSVAVTVNPLAANHLKVTLPAAVTAGVPFSVTVAAVDPFGNVNVNYTGSIHFTTSDGAAGVVLPGDYTFTTGAGGDKGMHVFANGATLITAGGRTITATDKSNGTLKGIGAVTVVAATATHLGVTLPAGVTAGNAFTITVKALDQFNNVASGYAGTVHFTSTDAGVGVVLPPDYTFTTGAGADNGAHAFTNGAILVTAGVRTVTVTDLAAGGPTGSANVTVTAAKASHFTLSAPATATAGSAFSVTVTALDRFNNAATAYAGTVHFTASDAGAGVVLPADYTFTTGSGKDNGVHVFPNGVTLVTAGSQTLTVKDTATGKITAGSAAVTVSPASATHFGLSAPAATTAGASFSLTVTALDKFNNVATNYAGTAHFTTSDPGAGRVLPPDYTFTSGDAGVHNFSGLVLVTAGNQTVTAKDAANSAISGLVSVSVSPAAATHFTVSAPNSASAGKAFTITVKALDPFNNVATGYNGTVTFTSTDPQVGVVLPNDYTFTTGLGGDNGMHQFTGGATLVTAGTQTVTATDTVSASITGSATIKVNPAAANHLVLSAPASAAAGAAFSVTVTALDKFNNVATGYSGKVHFSSTDASAGVALPADYTFKGADAGVHTFANGVTLIKTGSTTLTVSDTVSATINGKAVVIVNPGAPVLFQVVAPASQTAGNLFTVTITALDQFGNISTGYTGTVHFSSSDPNPGIVLPADYTFTSGAGKDNGVHTFSKALALATAGNQTVKVQDVANNTVTGSATVQITPAAVTHFVLSAPSSATAGVAFSVTATALDAYGNVVTGYTGTAHFSTTDKGPGVVLPPNYTYTSGSGQDNGVHTFSNAVALSTAGSQTLTVADSGNAGILGQATINVSPAAGAKYVVTAPASSTAGQAFSVTVKVLDAFGNLATGYAGTVHFSSTDLQSGVVLPANYTFNAAADQGSHTFTNGVTLDTAGTQTITAQDVFSPSVSGTANVSVTASIATQLSVSAPASAQAGTLFNVTVAALDAFGNTAGGYLGTVHFTSSDSLAILPGDYTFTSSDGGSHTFGNKTYLGRAGVQSITATDKATSSITGSTSVTVKAGPATHFGVGMPSSVTAGSAFNLTVTALDQFNNTAIGYLKTVHFSSSDPAAALPANYTFTSADAGMHTFTGGATLKTAGNQSVTATDTASSTVTGTASAMVVATAPSKMAVSAAGKVGEGSPLSVTVKALDAGGNVLTTYMGTMHFTSSDATAGLPSDYTFTAADAGVHTFAVVFRKTGAQSVTATDVGTGLSASAAVTVLSVYIAAGTDAGTDPRVNVYDAVSGALVTSFDAYVSAFTGGVRVAVADVNGDGVPDVITAPGPTGGPDVRIFRGDNGAMIGEIIAYDPNFTGGVFVAAGDINGDGFADVLTGPDVGGGPHVRAFSGKDGSPLFSFMAYDIGFTGGVRVAVGDVNVDGHADMITAAGPGGGPHVKIFSGLGGNLLNSFFAYDTGFSGGVYVAAGDVNRDGKADIITAPGAGGAPLVKAYDGSSLALLNSFNAYGATMTAGVRVAVTSDVNGDGGADIVAAAGPGAAQNVIVYDGLTLANLDSFFAFGSGATQGVFVGGR